MVQTLLSKKPNLIHERDVRNNTALLRCENSVHFMQYFRIISKFLIKEGSDVIAATERGNTLAHLCVYLSRSADNLEEAILYLMNKRKATRLLKMKNSEGNTPIHCALNDYDKLGIPLLKFMLKKSELDVNTRNEKGDTLLSTAIRGNQSVEMLRFLIKLGANYRVFNNDESNLLHLAAEVGNVEGVKLLMRLGLNLKHRNRRGKLPVECAINCSCYSILNECNHKKIVKMLNLHPCFKYIYYFLVCAKYFGFRGFIMYLFYVTIMYLFSFFCESIK